MLFAIDNLQQERHLLFSFLRWYEISMFLHANFLNYKLSSASLWLVSPFKLDSFMQFKIYLCALPTLQPPPPPFRSFLYPGHGMPTASPIAHTYLNGSMCANKYLMKMYHHDTWVYFLKCNFRAYYKLEQFYFAVKIWWRGEDVVYYAREHSLKESILVSKILFYTYPSENS